jgi:hypothetical protein
MSYEFLVKSELIEWRGPAPYYFVRIDQQISEYIKSDAKFVSYGWGVVPIYGKVGQNQFTTSLIPREGIYLIPIKDAVRKAESLELGELVEVSFNLGKQPN